MAKPLALTLRRISSLATQSEHDRFVVADAALLAQKARDAAANPRKREIHCFHANNAAKLHRMINALQPGTYVRPHRHLDPPKDEAFVLLTGKMGFICFKDDGSFDREDCAILDRDQGTYALDAPAGGWHAILALVPDTTLFEVKPGPYSPVSDKDFAPFAPADTDPDALAYFQATEDRFRMLMGLAARDW
ncbi:WbuC family cupin fold metalloprotein [Solidesulfovibrio sp. C21]|uniref:WbuC family cupin fold metalloprotein n=1 Tax=Solidesulfovibrio sp. C21 TaxID=3398613 RepID=UPI0039FD0E07